MVFAVDETGKGCGVLAQQYLLGVVHGSFFLHWTVACHKYKNAFIKFPIWQLFRDYNYFLDKNGSMP